MKTSHGQETIIQVLQRHVLVSPNSVAFRFLNNGEEQTDSLTRGQLLEHAERIGACLLRSLNVGDRVLLCFDSGLGFIRAFFGCLAAGIIPVPVDLPRLNKPCNRVKNIAQSCRPAALLTGSKEYDRVQRLCRDIDNLSGIQIHEVEKLVISEPESRRFTVHRSNDIAFLQYTSGSTGQPRGVVITHGNLITNQMQIQEGFGHDHTTKFVGWLPLFHDMGLVGNVLQPVFLGIESILMPPLSFVQRPLRWLRAISQYRATTSGAPNFAFEHCVGRIPVDEVPALDLSCWRVAFNGSEPVRGSTLRNFAAKFEKAGFSLDRFLPCYGLAEATLFASGRKTTPIPTLLCFLRSELEKGRAQPVGYSDERDVLEVVSCGKPAISQEVQVVDPETHRCLEEGGVGEIWISGPNVAYGYFGDDPTSVRTFQASLPGETRKYLRTGDLGFLLAGELYISGRIKDVMIIRGRNIYPHDVEQVVNGKHSLFLANRCVAFTLSGESGERLIIAQEISRRFPNSAEAASILDGIHADVIRHFDVIAENILFVTPGTLATTSSGKLQRHAVRQDYLNGKCEALYARSSTRQTT